MIFPWTRHEAKLNELRARVYDLEQVLCSLRDAKDITQARLDALEKETKLEYPSEWHSSPSSLLRRLAPRVPIAEAIRLLMQRAGVELHRVPEHPAHYTLEPVAKPKKV